MNNKQQTIQCPVPECGGQIDINPYLMLQGAKFACNKCHAEVGIAQESKTIVKDAMEKFDELKSKVLEEKQNS